MGYILPITQHTYQNYHYRMLESKSSPYYVGKPYKVMLQRLQSNTYGVPKTIPDDEVDESSIEKITQPDKESQRQHYYLEQQKKAELTGKGSLMNEQI